MSPFEKRMSEAALLLASPSYSELRTSAKLGDRSRFMSVLRAFYSNGVHSSGDVLTVLSSQNEQVGLWLIELFCNQAEDKDLRSAAFHAMRLVGAGAVAALRKGWDREQSGYGRGRIHMCMMDAINGAATNKAELPAIAEKEILLWMETLRTGEPRVRIWAAMILVSWMPYCPAGLIEPLRNQLSNFAACDVPAGDDNFRRDFTNSQRWLSRALGGLTGR